ncbi:hypothetical protein [Pseudomonas sp. P867]|nr:hypothetical protein [Pseudomonas sp. P867]
MHPSHALVGVEALDGLGREPYFKLELHELVPHRVKVANDHN